MDSIRLFLLGVIVHWLEKGKPTRVFYFSGKECGRKCGTRVIIEDIKDDEWLNIIGNVTLTDPT